MLVLVSRHVGAGDGGYGILLGAFGAGGLIGATVVARLDAPETWRRTLTIALVLVAAAMAALGQTSTLAQAVMLALLGGGGMIVGEVLSETAFRACSTMRSSGAPTAWRCRVSLGGIVIGSLAAGPLVSLLGLEGAFAAAGLFVATAAALLLRRPLTAAPAVAPAH